MNRKLFVAVVSGALALPMTAQGVEISVGGHINRALVFSSMSGTDDPNHVDAASSGSRFNFTGSEEFDNGVTAGVNLEYAAGGAGGDNPGLRHASVGFSGAFGALTVGQTAPATHLIGYANLDKHAWLSGVEIGCDFCKAAGKASKVFTSFGPGRMQVVRYNTPSLGPVALSVSANGNKFWDAALRASGEAGGITYSFNAGYTNSPAGDPTDAMSEFVSEPLPEVPESVAEDDIWYREGRVDGYYVRNEEGEIVNGFDRWGWDRRDEMNDDGHWKFTPAQPAGPASKATTLSAAFGLSQGTHFNLTWGQSDPDSGANEDFTHFGIGHNLDNTSIAATYTDSDVGGGGKSWALGVGHAMGSVQLYAGYKHLDHDDATAEDYGFYVVGSRVRFN